MRQPWHNASLTPEPMTRSCPRIELEDGAITVRETPRRRWPSSRPLTRTRRSGTPISDGDTGTVILACNTEAVTLEFSYPEEVPLESDLPLEERPTSDWVPLPRRVPLKGEDTCGGGPQNGGRAVGLLSASVVISALALVLFFFGG
jgi:hypothetical protein